MTRPPTSPAVESLNTGIRRVVGRQLVLVLMVAVAVGVWRIWTQGVPDGIVHGAFEAMAALYGGGITVLNTWWLGRRVQRAGEIAREQPQRGQLSLYAGAVQRFVVTLILLGIGLGWFKLAPIPLILAFAVSQLGFLANVGGSTRPSA